MKQKLLHSFLWCLLIVSLCGNTLLRAQTVDSTGLFTAIKAGSADTIVHASMIFYNVDGDATYDAAYTLSAGPITAWADYSTSVAFYATGIQGRNGGSMASTYVVPVVPGTRYDIWIDVDMVNKTANYWAKSPTMTYAALILANGGFRRTAIDSICRWSFLHNPSGEPDSIGGMIFDFPVAASSIPGIDVASLTSLTIDAGTLVPSFHTDSLTYNVLLPYGTNTVNIAGNPVVVGSTVTGTGAVDVSSGSATAVITVTSYDKSAAKTYTINFTVDNPMDDAILVDISASVGAIDPIFHLDTLTYDLLVPKGTASVDLSAAANYAGASITGDGTIILTGGSATANIKVKSADGTDSLTYVVEIMEADGKNYAIYLPGVTGTNSNIDISGLGVDTLPYTIEMWIKPEGTQINNAGLIYHRSTGNAGIQYSSSWQGVGKLRFMTNLGGDYGTVTDVVSTNAWHHIAAVLTDSTRTIYLDDKKYEMKITDTDYDFSTGKLYIGWDMGAADRAFKGIIDEVRIWNVYKDSATIADNKFDLLDGNEHGLAGYWNFDLQHQTLAVDLSANQLHGAITGGSYVPSFDPTDASLSGISVSLGGLDPYFNPDTLTYTVIVPTGTDTVFVSASASNPLAAVDITDTVSIVSGSGVSNINVTAFDGSTTRFYVVNFVEYDGILELKHSYTFENGSADDAVGSADGTMNGGTITNGIFTSAAEGDYITLPGKDLALNRFPSITLEAMISTSALNTGKYTMLTYFGGLSGNNSYWIQPTRNDGTSNSRTEASAVAASGIGTDAADTKYHIVSILTYDTIYYFINGEFQSKTTAANKIKIISTDNAWIGKGGWSDPTWLGSIHEFNIYEGEMSVAAIEARSIAFLTSNDAALSSLSVDVSALVPDFNATTTNYTVSVPYGTTSVTVTAVAADENATVSGDGAIDVSSGSGTATIAVTAEDGITKTTYTVVITVEQPSDDATLSALSLNVGSLAPNFDPSVTSYTATVSNGTTSVTVTATPNNENATVTGDGAIDVSSGSGTASVEVTAQDESTKLEYTVVITVEPGSGINGVNSSLARVYPTITTGNFNVEFTGTTGAISVYDITGQIILLRNAAAANESIEIPGAGIYFIHISSGEISTVVKVVKLN